MIPTISQVEELSALEQITFIGYPSGLYDDYNKTSLIRQGITATPKTVDTKFITNAIKTDFFCFDARFLLHWLLLHEFALLRQSASE